MPSGLWVLNIANFNANASFTYNNASLSPIAVRNNVTYSLLLVTAPLASGGAAASAVRVVLWGTHGASQALTLPVYGGIAGGATAVQSPALDVGVLQGVSVSVASPVSASLAGRLLVVQGAGSSGSVGFPGAPITTGSSVDLAVCSAFSLDCYQCNQAAGCGFCGSSGACVPGNATGPFSGDCAASTWASNSTQCKDGCVALSTCGACAGSTGCGWCASTCSCMAALPDLSAPTLSTCPSASWRGGLTAPCSGNTCSASVVVATANATMVGTAIALSGAGSTTCRVCGQVNCGAHGACVAAGPTAACACTDGYSGAACTVPPGPCYGVNCSGQGICVAGGESSYQVRE